MTAGGGRRLRTGGLARLLLCAAYIMCASSCPIPDHWVAVNNPPIIIEGDLTPANTGVKTWDCSLFPDQSEPFSVANAVSDPDVNDSIETMFIVWYVSTTAVDDETGEPIQKLVLRESDTFLLDCNDGHFTTGTNILTAYILDRSPVSTTDQASKIPGPDGFAVSASWVLDYTEK